MGHVLLTVDLGNSACKLALWPSGRELEASAAVAQRGRTPAQFRRALLSWLESLPGPCPRVALCSVAGAPIERALRGALRERWPKVRVWSGDAGLDLDIEQPHTLGRDRLFAARGAVELVGGSCLVVSVGTALTVDAVAGPAPAPARPAARAGGAGRARFLGGAIAPGPALLVEALQRGAARLSFDCAPQARAPALGKHSRAAMEAGVVHGLRGAAAELVQRIAAESGLGAVPVVLTGGAHSLLLEPRPFAQVSLRVDPLLVLRGLRAAAGE
jgi:type III pantothenate kinase